MSAALKLIHESETLSRKPPLGENWPTLRLVWENPKLSDYQHREKPKASLSLVSGQTLYRYVLNNPLKWTDPKGLEIEDLGAGESVSDEDSGQGGDKCKCWLTCLKNDPLLPELLPGLGAPLVNRKTPGEIRPGASSWTSVDRRLPPWTGANVNSGATVTRGAIQRVKCVGRYGTAAAAIGAFTAGYTVGAAGRCWVECL